MKEKSLRNGHRFIGISIALFVILQSVSGIMFSFEDFTGEYYDNFLRDIHVRLGYAGTVYRILLGMGLLWMTISGLMIYRKIRARKKAAHS
jgi:uncharacterized iron-regulated membrane protein